MFDFNTTVMGQYSSSPRLIELIRNSADYFRADNLVDDFYNKIMNIETASGYGLDVLGRIIGIGRNLSVDIIPDHLLGFDSPLKSYETFGHGNFFNGVIINNNFSLDDSSYRTLLYAQAYSNITDGSIRSINKILTFLFGSKGAVYVQDIPLPMVANYVFNFVLSALDRAIILSSAVPKPSGVTINIVSN